MADISQLWIVWTSILAAANAAVLNECSFPETWTRDRWMTHLVTSPPNTSVLVTYHQTYFYISTSENPHKQIEEYVCWVYDDASDDVITYVRVESSRLRTLTGTCVQERLHKGLVVHRESPYSYQGDALSPQSVIDHCVQEINTVSLYSIYLPVGIDFDGESPTWRLPGSVYCPIPNMPYRMVYTLPDGSTHCHNKTSGLTASRDSLSVLACDYNLHKELPLTGLISCKSEISPLELAETKVEGEGIVILEWKSRTREEPQYFCARYRQNADRSVDLSLDITTPRAVRCQRGAQADWFGEHGDRRYFTIRLLYDRSMLSSHVTPAQDHVTFPTTTTAAPPRKEAREHLQFTVDSSYVESLLMRDALVAALSAKFSSICMITGDRIVSVDVEKDPKLSEHTELTFHITEGRPTVQTCADILWHKMSLDGTVEVPVDGKTVNIVNGTIHEWRDDSLCPVRVCPKNGRCRLLRGQFTCQCANGGSSGHSCSDQSVSRTPAATGPGSDNRMVIVISLVSFAIVLLVIIIVVVFVLTRRRLRRSPAKEEVANTPANYSQNVHANGGLAFNRGGAESSLEEQDRQLYSTIGKQPAAYHEKFFLSDNEDDDHGEKTGIHVNSGYI